MICSSISRRVLAVPGAIVLYKGLKDEGERKGEGEGEAQGKDIQPPSRGLLRCHTGWGRPIRLPAKITNCKSRENNLKNRKNQKPEREREIEREMLRRVILHIKI